MRATSNGDPNGRPVLRFRVDERTGTRLDAGLKEAGHSGRRLVVVGVLVLLVLWGVLYLSFARWRARNRARAAFGAQQVAPVIDPLAQVVPDGVTSDAWAQAVSETHAMLNRLTGSGVLDLDQMKTLRADVGARVARARPETAIVALLGIWTDAEDKGGPLLSGLRRPALLELAIVARALSNRVPRGVAPAAWERALEQTYVMLVVLAASGKLTPDEIDNLSREISERIRRTSPVTVRAELTRIWNDLSAKAPDALAHVRRPELLEPAEHP